MKFPNKTKVFALWTDWNRPGAKGKYGGIGWYRIINPLKKIKNTTLKGEFTFGTEDRIKIAKYIKSKGDVMLIKYVDSFQAVNHILTIRDIMRMKLLVDIDDNVFKVHPHNYAYKDTNPNTEAYRVFQYLFREADGLICSTYPLASEMKKFNPNVYVIPNTIDPEIWKVPIKKNKTDKVKIGWVYGPTHEQDVPVILPAIKEILKRYPNVEFHHIGWKSEGFDNFSPTQQKMTFGTSGYKEFPKFLASLGIDILIAPLIDDEFNRGKSNIKWMEGAMCEIPMVCSDVYPYSQSIINGLDGYLAKSTSDWIKYLSELIENKEKREEIGKEAKKTVLKQYNVHNYLDQYVKIFKGINKPGPKVTVVVTRRKGESDQITIDSLKKQTYSHKVIRVEDVYGKGANWARNKGLAQVDTELVLFSDNDINWKPTAIQDMVKALVDNPECSYSFGSYAWKLEGQDDMKIACNEKWSPERLTDFDRGNIVSTMTLVRRKDFPGFDESIERLQDWEVWLRMIKQGKMGIHCGKIIFDTVFKNTGISASGKISYDEALKILKDKYEDSSVHSHKR